MSKKPLLTSPEGRLGANDIEMSEEKNYDRPKVSPSERFRGTISPSQKSDISRFRQLACGYEKSGGSVEVRFI
jgi:hypothetical protein